MNPKTFKERVMHVLDWTFPAEPVDREVLRLQPDEPTDRPPVLMVHGTGMGAWCWREYWMPALAERGWPTVAVSLRGHGHSGGREHRWRHTLRHYAHDVFQTIVDLDERPVLVGHSMGALVVERVLEQYDARAGVLLCPAPADHGLGMAGRIATHRPASFAKGLVGANPGLDPDMLFSGDVDPARAADWAARVDAPPPLVRLQLIGPRRTRDSKAPVLVIGSQGDKLIPPRGVRRTADAYNAELVMFETIGHAMMLDAGWEQPLEAMVDWLDGQGRDALAT